MRRSLAEHDSVRLSLYREPPRKFHFQDLDDLNPTKNTLSPVSPATPAARPLGRSGRAGSEREGDLVSISK